MLAPKRGYGIGGSASPKEVTGATMQGSMSDLLIAHSKMVAGSRPTATGISLLNM